MKYIERKPGVPVFIKVKRRFFSKAPLAVFRAYTGITPETCQRFAWRWAGAGGRPFRESGPSAGESSKKAGGRSFGLKEPPRAVCPRDPRSKNRAWRGLLPKIKYESSYWKIFIVSRQRCSAGAVGVSRGAILSRADCFAVRCQRCWCWPCIPGAVGIF